VDAFDLENLDSGLPAQIADPSRRPGWKSLFFGALGILMSLAIGLWTDKLIRDLFARADWLGWLATAMAALAALSATVIVVRELWGLARLASVEKLRRKAEDALARDDSKIALQVVEQLSSILASQPRVAAGRKLLAEQRGEVIDGRDLIRLAETEMLAPLDELARTLTLDAAKRVSIVTAVSPRALVDVAYVVFEAARLVKGISALYGGRPGTLGFLRLFRSVLAHLAVTGSIAVGDSFVQQIVGHGLAARLSAKLGEGVVNGMMTARIGLAAMDVVRPLPFSALKRPGMADFVSALTRFAAASSPAKK
jgi:putative membrane protein